jgi:hypothetical protein
MDKDGNLFMSNTNRNVAATGIESIPHLITAVLATASGKPIPTKDSIFLSFCDMPCKKSCIKAY